MENIGKIIGFVIVLLFITLIFIPGLGDITGRYINPEAGEAVSPAGDFSLLVVTLVIIAVIVAFVYILTVYAKIHV